MLPEHAGHADAADDDACLLQELYSGVPITAVTATATTRVQKDILSILGMQSARRFNVGPC
jgi:superfamily II DNA helicase RecQ